MGLASGVCQVVVSADNMRDAHVMVIDDNGMHIGRRPIAPQQDHIIELRIFHADRPLNLVIHNSYSVQWRFQTHNRINAFRCIGGVSVAPAAIIAHRSAIFPRRFSHFYQLFRSAVAKIGFSVAEQFLCGSFMSFDAARLVKFVAIPIQFKPSKARQNSVHRF